jgi:murein DD-endopeptidase MepM/ murein hydrolase activator NlpD
MNENNFKRSTSPRRSSKRQVKKVSSISVITIQIIVCIVLIIAAIGIKFLGGSFYKTAQSYCKTIFKNSITASDVAQVYNNFKSIIPNTSSLKNSSSNKQGAGSSSKAASSNVTSGSGSSSQTSGSNTSSANISAANVSSANTSSTQTSSTILNSLYVSSSSGGVGGQDISSSSNTSSQAMTTTMLPPKYCTIAPVLLSVKPNVPVTGRITSKFGYRIHPLTKKLSFHTGIDIANDEGTPIAAALPGTIKEVGVSNAYGNYVLMDNGGGVETFYGHCEQVIAPKGAVLRAGDIIAKLGNTGISTGPHLHFEIIANNVYTNPLWNLKIADFSAKNDI